MTRSQPLAVLVSGAPGSGKSTVGALIAHRLRAALLDLDTATASLTHVIGELNGTQNLDDPALARATRAARYEAIASLAEDNLAIGIDVVMVAPFSTERRDPAAWDALRHRLARTGANSQLVWLRSPPTRCGAASRNEGWNGTSPSTETPGRSASTWIRRLCRTSRSMPASARPPSRRASCLPSPARLDSKRRHVNDARRGRAGGCQREDGLPGAAQRPLCLRRGPTAGPTLRSTTCSTCRTCSP